jgi:response regulator RpfG family c-di-GMP phosphodiesterase
MTVSSHEQIRQPSVYDLWLSEAERLAIPNTYLSNMEVFLSEMKTHHEDTYEHSMRVGILASKISLYVPEFESFSPRALFYAGSMHDRGKLKIPKELLVKTTEWTEEDAQALRIHPIDSYEAISEEGMTLTANVVILHHTFQTNPYPVEFSAPDSRLPEHLRKLVPVLGRTLALADFYDACHRKNSIGNLSDEEIRTKMYQFNPDKSELIDKLYAASIFV